MPPYTYSLLTSHDGRRFGVRRLPCKGKGTVPFSCAQQAFIPHVGKSGRLFVVPDLAGIRPGNRLKAELRTKDRLRAGLQQEPPEGGTTNGALVAACVKAGSLSPRAVGCVAGCRARKHFHCVLFFVKHRTIKEKRFSAMRNPRKNRKGLTLIELVVVMTILIALAGLLIPTFAAMLTRGHTSTCSTNIGEAVKAVQQYQLLYGGYPGNMDSLTDASGRPDQLPRQWRGPARRQWRAWHKPRRRSDHGVALSGNEASALQNAGLTHRSGDGRDADIDSRYWRI